MLIKFLSTVAHPDYAGYAGDAISVSDEVGNTLIAEGYAEQLMAVDAESGDVVPAEEPEIETH